MKVIDLKAEYLPIEIRAGRELAESVRGKPEAIDYIRRRSWRGCRTSQVAVALLDKDP